MAAGVTWLAFEAPSLAVSSPGCSFSKLRDNQSFVSSKPSAPASAMYFQDYRNVLKYWDI